MSQAISPNLLARREGRRFGVPELISCALIFTLSYFMFYSMCLRPSSDISIHATWAAEGRFDDLDSFFHHGAHCMWHVLVALLLRLSISLPVAAALVTAACKALELWLVERLFSIYLSGKLRRDAIIALSLAAVTVSSLCVPQYNPYVYAGVGSPNTWHSATQMISMVFTVLCVSYVAHMYQEFERLLPEMGAKASPPMRQLALMGALLFLSLFAKPTFMQAFLPAACVFFGVMWIRNPKNSRFFLRVIVCVIPAVLLMILQYMYYFGIIVPHQGSMIIEISRDKAVYIFMCVLLTHAFPYYALISCRRRGGKDALYWLTLAFDIVGVLEFLILGESGRRAADGNFGWGMMGAAFMLWLVALIRFTRCALDDFKAKKRVRPQYIGGALLLMWHLASGVYYIVYLFTNTSVSL